MKKKKPGNAELVLFFTFVFMIVYAVSTYMYSTLMPTIKAAYGMNERSASLLTVSTSIGSMIITGLSALFLDRFDKHTVLGVSVVIYGTAFVLASFVPPLAVFLVLRVVDGMFAYLVMNLCSAYVSDIYGEERDRYIPILHTLFALGAVIGPKYAAWKIRNITAPNQWGIAYSVIGWVTMTAGILFLLVFRFVKKPELRVDRSADRVSPFVHVGRVLRNRNVIALCLSNLFMSGFFFFTGWLTTYFAALDPVRYTPAVYANIMSMYSAGMLLGVAASGFLSRKLGSNLCVRLLCVISFICALAALQLDSVPFWNAAMLIIGFAEGPYVTYIALMGLEEYPQYSATVTSLTSLFTGFGSIIVAPIMGVVAQTRGYGRTMYIATMILIIVYLVQLLLYRRKRS